MSRADDLRRIVGAEILPPTVAQVRAVHLLAVFAASFVIAFPRPGQAAFQGVLWAEDGSVFLQRAYTGHGWAALLTPYQGYALALPRVIASMVSYLPLVTHGYAMNAAAALVQASIAAFAFAVVRQRVRLLPVALVVPLGVAAVPVGPEVADNLSNLQWFLLFAACLAPLLRPVTAAGRAACVTVVVVTGLTSPLAVIAIPLAAVCWWVERVRYRLLLVWAGTTAVGVQLVVMMTAPSRQIPMRPVWNPLLVADGYLRRIVGDGVLGLGRYHQELRSSDFPQALGVAAMLLAIAWFLVHRQRWSVIALPGVCLMLSLLAYAPAVLGGVTGSLAPAESGRYSVTPVLLLYVAIAGLLDRFVGEVAPGSDGTAIHGRWVDAAVSVLAASLLIMFVYALASTWSLPEVLRQNRPSWASEVARGRLRCSVDPGRTQAKLVIAPNSWSVTAPCERMVGHD